MSSDKRLGANPLSWVDPNAVAKPVEIPITDTTGLTPIPVVANGGFFLPPDSGPANKEKIMEKAKVKIKETMGIEQVVTHLKDLTHSLESGLIRARDGEQTVSLGVAEEVFFEMKLSRKKDKAKCSIEIFWDDDGQKTKGSFTISDK